MAVKLLGVDPFEEAIWGGTNELDTDSPVGGAGVALVKTASGVPKDIDASDNLEGSRGGIQFLYGFTVEYTHTVDMFTARSQDHISYGIRNYVTVNAGFAHASYTSSGINGNKAGSAAGNGAVAIYYAPVSNTTYRYEIWEKNAGVWAAVDTSGASLTENSQHDFVTLQVDTTTGSEQVRILLDGAQYAPAAGGWHASGNILAAQVIATPGLGGKPTFTFFQQGIAIQHSECIVTEDSTAGIDLPATSGTVQWRAACTYPRSDGAVGNWVTGGDVSACGELWPQLDDAEDDDDKANDYIKTPDATSTDCLFAHAGEIDASATILGCAMIGTGVTIALDRFLIDDGGSSQALVPSNLVAIQDTSYVTLPTAPDTTPWTVAHINATQFGARASTNNSRIYGLLFVVVGKDQFGAGVWRGSKAAACVASTHQRAGFAFGSAGVGIY